MKRWIVPVSLAVLVSASVPMVPVDAHDGPPAGPCVGPVLQTTGHSEMTVAPDSFTAAGRIHVKAKTTVEATREANMSMSDLKKKINGLGIEGLVLKTTQYQTHSVYPPYDRHNKSLKKRQPIGYEHRQTLEVKLEGVTESATLTGVANKVLAAMSTVENVEPGQLRWYLSSGSPYELQLLEAAVKQARKRAEIMVAAAGTTLGNVCELNYHPNRHYAQPVMAKMARGMAADAMMESAAPQVEAGEQKLSTQVNVRYQLGQ